MKQVKKYAFSTILDTAYEDAVSKVTDALKAEGFGVLTEIDVKATLKKKLDKDFESMSYWARAIHPMRTAPCRLIWT